MSSPSGAHNGKNRAGWLKMLVILIAVLGFFFILFPEKSFFNTLISGKASYISVLYLKNLLAADPHNKEIKLQLAQHQFQIGQLQEAKKLIAPEITPHPQTALQWRYLLLHYRMLQTETFALKEKSPQRLEKEAELIKWLSILMRSPALTLEEAMSLGDNALSLDKPAIAMHFYQKAARSPGAKSQAFYNQAAKAALYVQDYQAGSEMYLKAMQQSSDLEQKRLYYMKAVDTINLKGVAANALNFAQKNLNGLAHDNKTLLYLAKLALSAGQPEKAENYINNLLQLTVQDTSEVDE